METATNNSGFDLITFWEGHQKDDILRMLNIINKCSEHEKDLMLKLLLAKNK